MSATVAEFPHMPLSTDAYLADTMHLDALQHGAYLLLLIVAWRSRGVPSLPDDDVVLARYAKVDPRTWRRIKPTIMAFWDLGADGRWTQKKQLLVRSAANKRAEAARDKAARRWGGKPLGNNDQDDAGALLGACQNDATITNSTIVEKEEAKASLSETAVSDTAKPSRKRAAYPLAFDLVWSAYPTDALMSKKSAHAAWSKLDAEDRNRLLASVPAFVEYCRKNSDYRPVHLVRYITDRRFDGLLAEKGGPQAAAPDWPKRLSYARQHKRWSSLEWGPMPQAAGCLAPRELIEPGDGVGWAEWTRHAS